METLPPARILNVVESYLLERSAGDQKLRDEQESHLAASEAEWRWLTHPNTSDPTAPGWEPEWWDEDEAGRQALRNMGGSGAARSA